MKIKNEDAFLKSIVGTDPIKKNNTLNKSIPIIKNNKTDTKKFSEKNNTQLIKTENKKNQSFFKLEKTKLKKKLKRGKIFINKKIDFHGLSVIEAQDLFFETVEVCYKTNNRCILFVTGKGVLKKNIEQNKETRLYYGKIREAFFSWTADVKMQKYILSVEQARIEHGADGAFYVYLRKFKN